MTSLLGVPNDPKLPNIDDSEWLTKWMGILERFGMALKFEPKAYWIDGYWIATVKSKNYQGGLHAIVMHFDRVAHDPSTKKRYKTGESLLGKDVVTQGSFLIVTDPDKLQKLQAWRKKLK